MPPKPQWFQRIPDILEEISAVEGSILDRDCIQTLFGVGRWQANALLQRFGALPVGNTFAIDRAELVTRLEAIRDGDDFRRETKRRERLAEALEEARQFQAARAVRFPVKKDNEMRRIESLGDGIHLVAGRLTVDFTTPEELLSKLYELGQTIAADLRSFERILSGSADESTEPS